MTLVTKPARDSRTMMTQLIFPEDANIHGTMFGGKVMEYMDKTAAISSMRHARIPVVTASTDNIDFIGPIRVGDAIEIVSFVTWTHKSSMEVYVKVQSENVYSGERKTVVTAFFTFVGLDSTGKPTRVPAVVPETDEEKSLHASAPSRYEQRRQRKRDRQNNA